MKNILFLAISAAFIVSCKKDSSKVDQDKIVQTYKIVYDAETNKTTFYAQFNQEKENGKDLELTGSSSITINGEAMERSGSVYSKTFNGLMNTGTFVFTDTEGKTYTNTINGEQSVSNDSGSYIDKSSSNSWYFGGGAVASGEQIIVALVNTSDSGKSSTSKTSTVGAYYVNITVSDMSNLITGDATATTKRYSESTSGEWTSVGGKKESTYSSTKSIVTVY